jgi:hypothetical protein
MQRPSLPVVVARFRVVVANRRALYFSLVCNGIATRDEFIEPPHTLRESDARHVQVCAGLFETRMAEEFLHVMQRPAGL